MAKALWQITDLLKAQEMETEFDKDSQTLFLTTETPQGDIQTRYYYDEEMEVLSCQCVYMQSFPKAKFADMCQLINLFNEELGFGAFSLMDEEDLVFEINHLVDAVTPLQENVVEKLTFIPSEAMGEHLASFVLLAQSELTPQQVYEKFWEE